ncbi:hypothetical protein HAP95_15550 [Acidithiobacillus sp. RW2]|uniref:Uncharacterized protein n=1 Tax=Acidithiobacillus sulfurivorans TaxID=1958756 RepID=A0ABS6A201_9PROT|nr:hypothetical protein [Acidithiobacillus sulfurivorans]
MDKISDYCYDSTHEKRNGSGPVSAPFKSLKISGYNAAQLPVTSCTRGTRLRCDRAARWKNPEDRRDLSAQGENWDDESGLQHASLYLLVEARGGLVGSNPSKIGKNSKNSKKV